MSERGILAIVACSAALGLALLLASYRIGGTHSEARVNV